MSYMNQMEFAPAAGIQELDGLEVDQIAGGPILIPIAYFGIGVEPRRVGGRL